MKNLTPLRSNSGVILIVFRFSDILFHVGRWNPFFAIIGDSDTTRRIGNNVARVVAHYQRSEVVHMGRQENKKKTMISVLLN